MATVYKITNAINEMEYVGVTTQTIQKRLAGHKACSNNTCHKKYPILLAMNEYGSENFNIEPIEECDDSIRFEREKYWIEKLKTVEVGYNVVRGQSDINQDEIIKTLRRTGSTYATANILGCSVTIAWNIAKKNKIKLGLKNEDKRMPVIAKMKDGTTIKFESISDGANYCIEKGLTKSKRASHMVSNIRMVCNGRYKHTYGMEWSYDNIEHTDRG